MNEVYITRRETFNSAHRLFNPEWTDEKNMDVFGKCSNPNWHGHNYVLYVTVKGIPNAVTGFVMDLKQLSSIINELILEKVDHKNLNLDVSFMQGIMPTTELFAKAIYHELKDKVKDNGASLHSIRLHETENNFAEYFG
ncbi:MAG TPA: 6-carboxytetrahydropterin synthase [Bacteroidia bacterium]|nr:6-carboxytetrahydropterin synthase [Bacteroidia bacterium]